MTTETYPGPPSYIILGTGPYAILHPYTGGAIQAAVLIGAVAVQLDPTEFTVTPAGGDAGVLTLSDAAAIAYVGRLLSIYRDTDLEQGWEGQGGAREIGLELQLDAITQKVQETDNAIGRTMRAARGSAPLNAFVPVPNSIVGFDGFRQPTFIPQDPYSGGAVTSVFNTGFTTAGAASYAMGVDPLDIRMVEVYLSGIAQTPDFDFTIGEMVGSPSGKGVFFIGNVEAGQRYLFRYVVPELSTVSVKGFEEILPDILALTEQTLAEVDDAADYLFTIEGGTTAKRTLVKNSQKNLLKPISSRTAAATADTVGADMICVAGLFYRFSETGNALTTDNGSRSWRPLGPSCSPGHYGMSGEGTGDQTAGFNAWIAGPCRELAIGAQSLRINNANAPVIPSNKQIVGVKGTSRIIQGPLSPVALKIADGAENTNLLGITFVEQAGAPNRYAFTGGSLRSGKLSDLEFLGYDLSNIAAFFSTSGSTFGAFCEFSNWAPNNCNTGLTIKGWDSKQAVKLWDGTETVFNTGVSYVDMEQNTGTIKVQRRSLLNVFSEVPRSEYTVSFVDDIAIVTAAVAEAAGVEWHVYSVKPLSAGHRGWSNLNISELRFQNIATCGIQLVAWTDATVIAECRFKLNSATARGISINNFTETRRGHQAGDSIRINECNFTIPNQDFRAALPIFAGPSTFGLSGTGNVGDFSIFNRATGEYNIVTAVDGRRVPLTGTISSSGSTITGVGTNFLNELSRVEEGTGAAGDMIEVNDVFYRVLTITNATSIEVTSQVFPAIAAGTSAFRIDTSQEQSHKLEFAVSGTGEGYPNLKSRLSTETTGSATSARLKVTIVAGQTAAMFPVPTFRAPLNGECVVSANQPVAVSYVGQAASKLFGIVRIVAPLSTDLVVSVFIDIPGIDGNPNIVPNGTFHVIDPLRSWQLSGSSEWSITGGALVGVAGSPTTAANLIAEARLDVPINQITTTQTWELKFTVFDYVAGNFTASLRNNAGAVVSGAAVTANGVYTQTLSMLAETFSDRLRFLKSDIGAMKLTNVTLKRTA